MVQEANKLNSDKVTCAFLFHPAWFFIYRTNVNFPKVSWIPGLADLDRTTIS
jgi:hypothetical protein